MNVLFPKRIECYRRKPRGNERKLEMKNAREKRKRVDWPKRKLEQKRIVGRRKRG
jgi:hypothetical protein